jgi:hypothetical protein
MKTPLAGKSTIDEIRRRFDNDVDRSASLETGQPSTIDAALAMTLISEAAVACTQPIRRVLDIGCGAGNNTVTYQLELLRSVGFASVDLLHKNSCFAAFGAVKQRYRMVYLSKNQNRPMYISSNNPLKSLLCPHTKISWMPSNSEARLCQTEELPRFTL